MKFKFINKESKKDSKNEKKQIFMYAVILFTGAFIVLLLTAYSQVKFQNNISDYQSKLSSEEKAKLNVVTNLNSAVSENKRLKAELESLRDRLVESEQKLAIEEQTNIEMKSKMDSSIINNDLLLSAFEYYQKEDYINCATTLKYQIDKQYLSPKAVQSYNDLVKKTYEKASKKLYSDGYRNYKKGKYGEAIINFNRAIDFAEKNDYYVDDAYYYLASSYYKTYDYVAAKKIINTFLIDYPNSKFVPKMKSLLNRIG